MFGSKHCFNQCNISSPLNSKIVLIWYFLTYYTIRIECIYGHFSYNLHVSTLKWYYMSTDYFFTLGLETLFTKYFKSTQCVLLQTSILRFEILNGNGIGGKILVVVICLLYSLISGFLLIGPRLANSVLNQFFICFLSIILRTLLKTLNNMNTCPTNIQ